MSESQLWTGGAELSLVTERPWVRYLHFLRIIASTGVVWMLADESGFAQKADTSGRRYLPLWPSNRLAELCIPDWNGGLRPEAVPVKEFIETYVQASDPSVDWYDIFPVPTAKGYLTDSIDLYRDYCADTKGEIDIMTIPEPMPYEVASDPGAAPSVVFAVEYVRPGEQFELQCHTIEDIEGPVIRSEGK